MSDEQTPPETTYDIAISPAEFSAEYRDLLGRAILRWSLLETHLAELLAAIMDMPEQVGITLCYSQNTLKARLDLIRSAQQYLMMDIPEREKIRKFLKRVSHLSSYRNKLVHYHVIGEWDPPDFYFLEYRPATETFARTRPAKAADIRNHINSVGRISAEIGNLLNSKKGSWLRDDMPGERCYVPHTSSKK